MPDDNHHYVEKKFVLSISCVSTIMLMDIAKTARHFSVLGCFNISSRETRNQSLKYKSLMLPNYCEL